MSSLKSRFVLKCWSFYNSCKTRMDIEKTARAWKIALTVLITVGGSLLILFSIPLWPDDPTGILVFLSFQPFALLIALIWVKGKRKPIAAVLVGSLVLFLFFTDVVLGISRGYRTSPYPQTEFLKEFKNQGFGAVITSDCHNKSYLDCYYKEARELLLSAGFKTIWKLTDAGFKETEI